jgi:uncharacterized protein (DUF486 family)
MAALLPVGLLIVSNPVMTYAWYGHLGNSARARCSSPSL